MSLYSQRAHFYSFFFQKAKRIWAKTVAKKELSYLHLKLSSNIAYKLLGKS